MTDNIFKASVSQLVANNQDFSVGGSLQANLSAEPKLNLAIVTCMDARLDVLALLGLKVGEAHVIRNGGGVVTEDVVRSVCLSQKSLGTREIVLIHHTQCGLHMVDEHQLKAELESEFGVKPSWALEGFDDPHDDVRQSAQRLKLSPFVLHKENISGFVYNVSNGLLEAVEIE